jgi:spermidine/putrescine transport system substrate-binding protein
MQKHLFGAAVAVALSFVAGQASAQEKIVISNWDAYMPEKFLENFTKETGVQAELSVHATNEEIMGKVMASGGKGYDVLFVSSPFAEVLNKQQMLAPLDQAKIPNLANLYPAAMKLPYDEGNKFSAPYTWGTTGLCYRSDLVKAEPTSWNDLLKPSEDAKGKVTMLATERWLMAAGLKALGYSVNETDEAKVGEAKALLIEAKKSLLAYDDTTFYSKLVSGEAILVHAWDGWCSYGIAENDKIKFVIPKEGSDMFVDTMVVPAASENKDAAMKFINYVLSEANGKAIAETTFYKVPNAKGMAAVDPALLKQHPPLAITAEELNKQEQLRDLGDAQKLYSKTVTEITSAN